MSAKGIMVAADCSDRTIRIQFESDEWKKLEKRIGDECVVGQASSEPMPAAPIPPMDALRMIYEYGLWRDGETTAERLGELVDELVEIAKRGMGWEQRTCEPNNGKHDFCGWAFDGNLWTSDCGLTWEFPELGPKENGVAYCPKCGKPVRLADEPNKEK